MQFATRCSFAVPLGVILGCVLWFAASGRDASAVGAEPADGAGQSTAAREEAAATWQDTVKMLAAALAISLTAFATAFTQRHIGSAGVGALAENPKLFGNILIFLVVPETMVILGFVIAALILF